MDVTIAALMQVPLVESHVHLNPDRVAWYADHLDEAPPVTVFETEEGLFLADGHHRVAAAQRLGRTAVKADVRHGTRQDALRFAVALAQDQRGLTESEVIDAIRRRSGDRWGETSE